MKFERFARTFCRNVGTFGANLWNLFPNLRIPHSKIGQETSKLGARMNRFDCNLFGSFVTLCSPNGLQAIATVDTMNFQTTCFTIILQTPFRPLNLNTTLACKQFYRIKGGGGVPPRQ